MSEFKTIVERFSRTLEAKHQAIVELNVTFQGQLILNSIFVPKDQRGLGIGTQVLEAIADFADENDKIVVLDPSTSFGATSVNRLKRFYRQFGFVSNSGRNKDFVFRQAMIRHPNGRKK